MKIIPPIRINKCRLHTLQIINSFKIRTWNNTIIHACANYVNVSLNEVKKCYWIDKHIYQVPNPYSLPQFWGRIGSFGGKTNNSATLGELIGPQKLSSGSDSIVFEIWIFFNPSLPVNEPINHQRSVKRPSGRDEYSVRVLAASWRLSFVKSVLFLAEFYIVAKKFNIEIKLKFNLGPLNLI